MREYRMETRQWLQAITKSPRDLTHFIALLAELESIGAHKIRCCAEEYGWGPLARTHLGEESTHAGLFRKLLQTLPYPLANREKDEIRQMAHDYFQPLDHGTSDHLSALSGGYNPHLCYLLVSYLVECRALEVYDLFAEVCTESAVAQTLGLIIEDERAHLSSMESQLQRAFAALDRPFDKTEFTGLESRLFENLQGRVIAAIQLSASPLRCAS